MVLLRLVVVVVRNDGTLASSVTRNMNFIAILLGLMVGVLLGGEVMHHSNHYFNVYYYYFLNTYIDYQQQ